MLSAEIDRDPTLIFKLRGFDIVKSLKENGIDMLNAKSDEIPGISSLIRQSSVVIENKEFLVPDLKKIENMKDRLISLLNPSPFFYNAGDFKEMLTTVYKKLDKNRDEETEYKHSLTYEFTKSTILFDEVLSLKECTIQSEEQSISATNHRDFHRIETFLNEININTIEKHTDNIAFLFYTFHFACRIFETGNFIPAIYKFTDKYFILKYIPYLIPEATNTIFKSIQSRFRNAPVFMVKSYITDSKPEQLDSHSATFVMLSLFLEMMVRKKAAYLVTNDDPIQEFFFKTFRYTVSKFYESEIPYSIRKWLSKFNITQGNFTPVIKITEKENDFLLSYEILFNTNEYIPLKKILYNDNYTDLRLQVLKKFGTIAEYYEKLNIITDSNGSTPLTLNSDEFSIFFDTILPILNILGVELLLPKELNKVLHPALSIKASARTENTTTYFQLQDITRFNYTIALGNNFIDPATFLEEVNNRTGLIKIKDQFIHITKQDIEKIISRIKKPITISEKNSFQAILEESHDNLEIITDDELRENIKNRLQLKNFPLPAGLNATLREYQKAGYNWLNRNISLSMGSILADDMGLGKTIQTISVLQRLKETGVFKSKKALIIVPTALLTNWEKEIEKFTHDLRYFTYYGAIRSSSLFPDNCDIVITTYGIMRNDIEKLNECKWAVVIFDEAQNLKNIHTDRTKAALKIKADHKIALSGTPVENRLTEFWSIMNVVNRGYLGTIEHFKERFAYPIEKEFDAESIERFKKITSPFFLRRIKTDKSIISDLPDKIEIDELTHLTAEQTTIYQGLVDNAMDQIKTLSGMERRGLIFKLLTALKQVCNHPANYLKNDDISPSLSGKSILLLELLNDIYESGNKVIIFTQYREMGDILKQQIQKTYNNTVLYIHGGLTREKRDASVKDFQDGCASTMILTIKAGGTGLNLTAANYVIHFDLWWNPAVEAQATDRAYRIGQNNNVMVYRLITEGTFEEKIDRMLKTKKELANLTVENNEQWISEFDNESLEELLIMRK